MNGAKSPVLAMVSGKLTVAALQCTFLRFAAPK